MTRNFVTAGLLVLALHLATDSHAAAPVQKAAKLDKPVNVKLDYLIYLPADYEKQDAWPLMIFLHGAGERGDNLDLVKTHGPPKLVEQGKSLPFIVVSPQCPQGQWWSTKNLELLALVDEIIATHKVDRERVYLTGLSMGGFGTWSLAAYAPDRFAAIVPICGGGEGLSARQLVDVPVWAFHGAKDLVVPLKRSEDMVAAVERVKGDAKLTIYPEAGHDSWSETYANQEVYDWLLKHRKPQNKPATK